MVLQSAFFSWASVPLVAWLVVGSGCASHAAETKPKPAGEAPVAEPPSIEIGTNAPTLSKPDDVAPVTPVTEAASVEDSSSPPFHEEPIGDFESKSFATVTLQRTACLGTCPVYSVAVRSDGAVMYSGDAHVKVHGLRTGRIPPDAAAALLRAFEAKGFWRMRKQYRGGARDVPSVVTTLRRGGRTHRVERNVIDDRAPAALEALEENVEETAGSARWVGRPGERTGEP